MRCTRNLLLPVIVLAACGAALAQTPSYSNVGRTPTEEEIRARDTAIGTEGKELPPGSGTAKEGAKIYAQRGCASCHGPTGAEGSGSEMWVYKGTGMDRAAPRLVGGKGTLTTPRPVRTIGSFWPFPTTIWDYINRAMPPKQPDPKNPGQFIEGGLSADEVYALTAFLLYRNGIIQESDVMDAKSLPKIQMPNRNGFIPPRLEDIHDPVKRGCRLGICP